MPDNETPDIYVDQFLVTLGVFGANMTFILSDPHPAQGGVPRQGVEKVRLRMSLEHAKIMTMLLRRQLKQYETENGVRIQIPAQVYSSIGIAEEDWGI